jgi:quercetin dioxygenase-like cupin family protein
MAGKSINNVGKGIKQMLSLVSLKDVKGEPLTKGNARGTWVKPLIDQRHGATKFYLRVYEVEPGGQTPYDQHPYEHEVFVLKGRAHLLTVVDGVPVMQEVKEGDAVFIASNQVHQFLNTGQELFQMLCVKGAEHLYTSDAGGGEPKD